jgi:hypothetical protein
MMARDPIARPGTAPTFSGRLTKVTGEGEQVELAFIADTAEELIANFSAACVAAAARLKTNNDTIVQAGATFEQRQRQVYDAAVSTLREEIQQMTQRREEHEPPADEPADDDAVPCGPAAPVPVGPPAPGDAPAEGDDEPDADASAGTVHPPTYP